MKILDACCGGKMFWYEKNLEFVDFQDNRELQTELCDGRKFSVKPDFIGDVTKMDIPDEKWNGEQIPFAEVVKLSLYKPIFGDKRAKTRWTVFVKNAALRKGEKA